MNPSLFQGALRLSLIPLLVASLPALAQQAPDAGQLLRQQPKAPAPQVAPPPQDLAPKSAEDKEDSAGPRILVKGFRIVGATLVAESEIQAQLADAIGKEYSLSQLRSMALFLTGYYAQQGYLARILLAPQEFKDGIITFTIVEGKVGELKLNLDTTLGSPGVDAERAKRFISSRVPAGAPLRLGYLGEAMAILNEQPGIQARASLKPGKGEGEVDLHIAATTTRPVFYGLQVNNHGARATGEYQVSGHAVVLNPIGAFDQAVVLFNASEGISYMSGDYSLASGDGGLRLGVNGSALSYRGTQSTFALLRGNGNADTLSLYASYPLRRQTRSGLTVAGNVNRKHLKDSISGIETNHRATTVATVGLSGWEYAPTINGMATFGADVSIGRLDRSRNAGDLAQDQLGRRSDGHFGKLSWRAGHIAALGDTWSLATRLNGQFANRGLDSSERFTLGGPTGVRAYAASEGSGDEGWFLSLNLMRSISDAMNLQFFIDHGQTRLNKTLWTDWNADNPRLSNRYSLSGIGAGIDWKIDKSISLNLTLATPLGKNPGRDSNGLDSDGRYTGARLWASLVAHF